MLTEIITNHRSIHTEHDMWCIFHSISAEILQEKKVV